MVDEELNPLAMTHKLLSQFSIPPTHPPAPTNHLLSLTEKTVINTLVLAGGQNLQHSPRQQEEGVPARHLSIEGQGRVVAVFTVGSQPRGRIQVVSSAITQWTCVAFINKWHSKNFNTAHSLRNKLYPVQSHLCSNVHYFPCIKIKMN